jgi:hypothetical protein
MECLSDTAPTGRSDDEEIAPLNAEYVGRWHVTRTPAGALNAAREPGRGYHVVAMDAGELAESIAIAERDGALVR